MQKGDFALARKHGYLLLDEIRQLHAAEPGNPGVTMAEAGALYNMSEIEERVGQTAVAIECARKALELYARLGVVGSPAEIALAAGLERVATGLLRPPGLPPLAELASEAADARVRLARLLAKALGPAAAQDVHQLGGDAVEIYERVIATGLLTGTDGLRGVVTQYAVARDTLAMGYLAAGEQDQAIALYQDLLADCERTLSADDPVTATVRGNLSYARGRR
jgi:tetratricopeptide (TPR) repeat protein